MRRAAATAAATQVPTYTLEYISNYPVCQCTDYTMQTAGKENSHLLIISSKSRARGAGGVRRRATFVSHSNSERFVAGSSPCYRL